MIRILSQSEGDVLSFQANKKLSILDYRDMWILKFNKIIAKHDKICVLLCLNKTFHGWGTAASLCDVQFGIALANDTYKFALSVVRKVRMSRNALGALDQRQH